MVSLALLALGQVSAMPVSLTGVWISNSGQCVIINSTHSVQMMLGERHLAAWNIQAVPDGSFLGVWRATRKMEADAWTDTPDRFNLFPAYPKESSAGQTHYPMPLLDATRAEAGEIRFSAGVNNSLKAAVTDTTKATKYSDLVYPVLPLDQIDLGGSFAGDKASAVIQDGAGKRGAINGTLTIRGESFLFKGQRSGARAFIKLGLASNDREVGKGYIEWAPTLARGMKLRNKESKVTDQVILGVTVNGENLAEFSLSRN